MKHGHCVLKLSQDLAAFIPLLGKLEQGGALSPMFNEPLSLVGLHQYTGFKIYHDLKVASYILCTFAYL